MYFTKRLRMQLGRPIVRIMIWYLTGTRTNEKLQIGWYNQTYGLGIVGITNTR